MATALELHEDGGNSWVPVRLLYQPGSPIQYKQPFIPCSVADPDPYPDPFFRIPIIGSKGLFQETISHVQELNSEMFCWSMKTLT
jgi:hypothetical protein